MASAVGFNVCNSATLKTKISRNFQRKIFNELFVERDKTFDKRDVLIDEPFEPTQRCFHKRKVPKEKKKRRRREKKNEQKCFLLLIFESLCRSILMFRHRIDSRENAMCEKPVEFYLPSPFKREKSSKSKFDF